MLHHPRHRAPRFTVTSRRTALVLAAFTLVVGIVAGPASAAPLPDPDSQPGDLAALFEAGDVQAMSEVAPVSSGPLAPGWVNVNGYDGAAAILAGMTSAKFTNTSSGWSPSSYGARGRSDEGGDWSSPGAWRLSEPYYTGTSSGFQRWQISFYVKWTLSPVVDNFYLRVKRQTICSATPKGVGVLSSTDVNSFNAQRHKTPLSTNWLLPVTCPVATPFLQAVSVTAMQTPVLGGPEVDLEPQWWSSGQHRLGGRPVLPGNPYCEVNDPTYSNECLWVGTNDGGRGGAFGDDSINAKAADFAIVCKDPPAAEWLSFSWLGPWVGHYADCLFKPRGGLSLDAAEREINDSFVGSIQRLGTGVAGVSMPATRCGILADSTMRLVAADFRLVVDTCAEPWPRFAPIRTTLGIALIVLTVISSVYGLARVAGFNYAKGGAA